MSPSPMTDGQIEKILEQLRAKLRKRRGGLPSDVVQLLIGEKSLGEELVSVIAKLAESLSGMINRIVIVDRSRTPQQMIEATGWRQDVDDEVVKTIPQGKGRKKQVFFFRVDGRCTNNADLEKEYKCRGLVPDPYAQIQANINDPAFADHHPNLTYWKDVNGHWCFVIFDRVGDVRNIHVRRYVFNWLDFWWFCGVRK